MATPDKPTTGDALLNELREQTKLLKKIKAHAYNVSLFCSLVTLIGLVYFVYWIMFSPR